ncbi:MAG: abortive infection family protein [Thermoleophilia bacterium]
MTWREAMTDDGDEARAMRLGREHLFQLLARDGIEPDSNGALRPVWGSMGSEVLEDLPTESAILRDVERMRQAVETEPDAAVGAAKDLVESALKHALHELGVPFTEKQSLSELADLFHRELGLHPQSLALGRGSEIVRKILGTLLTQVKTLTELRNLYGVGHGRLRRSPLQPRHARLAAKAAETYVTFVLDTLADDKAPWKRHGTGATDSRGA